MRSSLALVIALAACAPKDGAPPCHPVTSWSMPAFRCSAAAPVVAKVDVPPMMVIGFGHDITPEQAANEYLYGITYGDAVNLLEQRRQRLRVELAGDQHRRVLGDEVVGGGQGAGERQPAVEVGQPE